MKTMAVLIFPGIQTLDLFGPIEMLGGMLEKISISFVAETMDPLPTRHGHRILPDRTIGEGTDYDLLLIPGGDSALDVAKSDQAKGWIVETSNKAELVMTVCTGSILLAMTGVLDGRRATTNKLDFTLTVHLGPNVDWVREARWVEDGKFFTSSGVSAGMDMALAAVSHVFGRAEAEEIAEGTEYEWHDNAAWDPFAKRAGLV